jgi:hypothetical protein
MLVSVTLIGESRLLSYLIIDGSAQKSTAPNAKVSQRHRTRQFHTSVAVNVVETLTHGHWGRVCESHLDPPQYSFAISTLLSAVTVSLPSGMPIQLFTAHVVPRSSRPTATYIDEVSHTYILLPSVAPRRLMSKTVERHFNSGVCLSASRPIRVLWWLRKVLKTVRCLRP